MKAWDDLERSVSLYRTGPDNNPTSLWYVDHGVKIERFEDRYEINNVMIAGDGYQSVSDAEYAVFQNEGWLPGCYTVCINTFTRRLNKVNYLISVCPDPSERLDVLLERRSVLEEKVLRYLELTKLLDKFAQEKVTI